MHHERPPGRISVVTVLVSTEISASRERVWQELARIEEHVTWMMDATAIRFEGQQRQGIGTRFECDTRVGPLRLTDLMEVTEWEPGERIGVRHSGAVSGSGRFSLSDAPDSATIVAWEEQLLFPLWLGAGLGAQLARPLFTAIWKGNLRRLARRVIEASPPTTKAGTS
jgi:Polyketide cyclase / dehydrase and lipid transport